MTDGQPINDENNLDIDATHPRFWIDYYDKKKLLEIVNENDDYSLRKESIFWQSIELSPDKQYAIQTKIDKIDSLMKGDEFIEEDILFEHGGSKLIRWGYQATLEGQNDYLWDVRTTVANLINEFRDSNTPLIFIRKYIPKLPIEKLTLNDKFFKKLESDPGIKILRTNHYSLDLAWLEGLFYIVRGGNYALHRSWLNEQLQSQRTHKSLDKQQDIPIEGLPERVLFADRLGIITAIASTLRLDVRSKDFHIIMSMLFGVTQAAIEKYIRQSEAQFPHVPAGNRSVLRSIRNYEKIIQEIETKSWSNRIKKGKLFSIFERDLRQLTKGN